MADPVVLALDTSTVVNVGLARGGEVLGSATVPAPTAHVEQLTPLVRAVVGAAGLDLRQVDLIVVGLGPGPFTGLRVGIVTARVLAAALRRPLHGICSHDVLAADYAAGYPDGAPEPFLVVTDARRRELYWAGFDRAGRRTAGPQVNRPDALPDLPAIGPGIEIYPGVLRRAGGPVALDPGVLATQGPALPSAGTEPLYLRRPDAAEPAGPKRVLLQPRGQA